MSDQNKLEQLEKAVQENPNDELAQFSLACALMEAGRDAEAGPCLQRVLAINSQHSKAYELLGTVQSRCGQKDLAIETLAQGYRVASHRGDMMPAQAMADLLHELGAEAPSIAEKGAPAAKQGGAGDGTFSCRRCGGNGPALQKRPFKGELGETILSSVCESCWREWVAMGTKVINELRLPMYDPKAQEMYDQHMKEFFLIQ